MQAYCSVIDTVNRRLLTKMSIQPKMYSFHQFQNVNDIEGSLYSFVQQAYLSNWIKYTLFIVKRQSKIVPPKEYLQKCIVILLKLEQFENIWPTHNNLLGPQHLLEIKTCQKTATTRCGQPTSILQFRKLLIKF